MQVSMVGHTPRVWCSRHPSIEARTHSLPQAAKMERAVVEGLCQALRLMHAWEGHHLWCHMQPRNDAFVMHSWMCPIQFDELMNDIMGHVIYE